MTKKDIVKVVSDDDCYCLWRSLPNGGKRVLSGLEH
jgi:hypothetical protein